jgi:hypothetical protein
VLDSLQSTVFTSDLATLTNNSLPENSLKSGYRNIAHPDYVPGGSEVTWIQDSIQLAADLHQIFETANIPYYVTGGVAAIAYGESRTTQDLDVVMAVARNDIPTFATLLEQAGFYVPGVEDATSGRMHTLQVTQMNTIYRADLVIADINPYEQLKFARRQAYRLNGKTEVYLASPEDVVVNKLRWGKQSQSQKQWRDVLGVLKAQQEILDYEYMHHWAAEFDLSSDLEQVTLEAGVRQMADQQWAAATYGVMRRAFALAQSRDRTTNPTPDQEVADGNLYILISDAARQTFTVVARVDDRDVAQFKPDGTVLMANPSLQDRRQWQTISQAL